MRRALSIDSTGRSGPERTLTVRLPYRKVAGEIPPRQLRTKVDVDAGDVRRPDGPWSGACSTLGGAARPRSGHLIAKMIDAGAAFPVSMRT